MKPGPSTGASGPKAPPHRLPAPRPDVFDPSFSAYHEELLAQNEELQDAQRELEKSRDRYARLYDEAPVGYLTLDGNGVVEGVNATALKLLGTRRLTLLGRPLLVFAHPADRAAFLNYLLACRTHVGQARQWVELRLRHAAGHFVHVQLSSVAVSRDAGSGSVLLTALTDISGRVHLERERRRAEERVAEATRQQALAQAANEAKDRFLAMLSHELRTPLTPAVLRLSDLAGSADLPEAARDEIDLVLSNVKLEIRLIDDLLDLNRILSGKFEVNLEQLDLRDVITKSLQFCQPDASARTVILSPRLFAHRSRSSPTALGSSKYSGTFFATP